VSRVRLGLALAAALLGGLAVGGAVAWTHQIWWALVVGVAATLTTLLWLRPWALRLGFAAGWMVVAAWATTARDGAGYLISSNTWGYAYLGLGLVVLAITVATVPVRRSAGPTAPPGVGPNL
jgi:hypothetical protein